MNENGLEGNFEEDTDDLDLENDKKSTAPLKKGMLWQQRDKLFSQWKERYFILTPDYLQCFKKGSSRITEMGEFIFKVRNKNSLETLRDATRRYEKRYLTRATRNETR
jgi:hypothetical protein